MIIYRQGGFFVLYDTDSVKNNNRVAGLVL